MDPQIQSNYVIAASVIIGSFIIAGAIVHSTGSSFGTPAVQQQQTTTAPAPAGAPQVDASKVKSAGEPFIGNANAPLTIAYWYDYQCPFCGQNEETTMPQIVKNYVDTGKVKIIFKDFAFLGPDSQTLGKVSRAVWDIAPDKFYAWHKAIFDNQGTENTGWATTAKIRSITAGALGASVADTVMARATSNATAYQKSMDADKTEGTSLGINGTPGFVIGKSLVAGALPYEQIKTTIDTALNAAR